MIRPDLRALLTGLVIMLAAGNAHADWIEGERARLQALDKITARISTLEVPIDTPVLFGTLSVTVRRCAYHPPEDPPEDAAFLQLLIMAMTVRPRLARCLADGCSVPARRSRRWNILSMTSRC